jgi:hypothetical protein
LAWVSRESNGEKALILFTLGLTPTTLQLVPERQAFGRTCRQPQQLRKRLRETFKRIWRKKEWSQTMSDLRDKSKKKIDDAANAAKKAAHQVVDKSKDIARSAGKKMEEGGKRLQDA